MVQMFTNADIARINSSRSTTGNQDTDSNGVVPVHWATKYSGLAKSRTGNKNAATWWKGVESRRSCLGVIKCENEECAVVIHPLTRPGSLEKQLTKLCKCGSKLYQTEKCPAKQTMFRFKHGLRFVHENFHNHERPTYILHLTRPERTRFEEIIKQHPSSGPIQHLVGVRTLDGRGPSISEISPVLNNPDRLAYERNKVKDQYRAALPSGFTIDINNFHAFSKANPGFIVSAVLSPVVVISMQSHVLLSDLVTESKIEHDQVNGMLTDAAHGFWKETNHLLIVSSSYSQTLRRWLPALISYSNGASAEHYAVHFAGVFKTLAQELIRQGLDTSDDAHFCNVGRLCICGISQWCLADC